MSGPLAGMFGALLENMSERNEFALFIDDAQRQRILRGLFEQYYADTATDLIFDTSRAWCARLPALAEMFPEAKVIACVRDMAWVIDSIERLIQCNAFRPSSIFGYSAGGTVYSRVNGVAGNDGMVGYAYDALKQACYGAQAERLLLLQYETLTSDPARAMRALYDFIGEPVFEHDFEHVDYDASAFDERAGTPGLHHVRHKVQAQQRRTVLPPDLFNRFANDAFWRNSESLPAGVRIV